MDSKHIREKYIRFFVERGHKQIPPAKLVPENDPTTLFTSSGMQPLVPYLLGQEHPEGKRLVDSQPSFRAEDIEEVGDNRHTTFFEMLGNWSLGDYFKKEQLSWFWEFLTEELGLPKEKLYVSVFEGNKEVPKDTESLEIWKSLGVAEDHIFFYGVEKNWWSRSGPPDKMPVGEIGGPDSEVFYEFTQVEHDKRYGDKCHPNCNCGRFLEIGNSVFIQYQKTEGGSLKELAQKNVDFGGGLERLVAASLDTPDIFMTDLFRSLINSLETFSGIKYGLNEEVDQAMRIIVDHIKAASFLIKDGILPSNKLQGYVLRRLIRRATVKSKRYFKYDLNFLANLSSHVFAFYKDTTNYFDETDHFKVHDIIFQEVRKFESTLDKGLKEIKKRLNDIDIKGWVDSPENAAKFAFDLFQTYGLPMDAYFDDLLKKFGIAYAWGQKEDLYREFEKLRNKHSELSRTTSAGMFKGGLADHSEIITKYHTATHLLHQALRDVLGPQVFQRGSNITSERLRFDFSFDRKMTDKEIKQTEEIINEKISKDLKVDNLIVGIDKAKTMNAIGLFDEKYADKVSIYGVGPGYNLDPQTKDTRVRGGYYSLEFCGGPHVEHTRVIGKVKITKEEAISSGIRRIRAEIVLR